MTVRGGTRPYTWGTRLYMLPKKRKVEVACLASEEAPYAQYGVTHHEMTSRVPGGKSCIILCKSWPCWLWAALHQDYEVKLVIVQDDQWFNIIKQLSPTTEVIVWRDTDDKFWPVIDVAFTDFDLKGILMSLWNYITKAVVTLRALRNPPPGWGYTKLHISHSNCGGVTNGRWNVHVYRVKPKGPLVVRTQAPRDLSAIIDTMVSGGCPCTTPKEVIHSKEPQIIEVRPKTYHCKGLVPWGVEPIWAVVPSVFSPSKWCRRKLTAKEILLSRDISHQVLCSCDDKTLLLMVATPIPLPGKCCTVCLEALDDENDLPNPNQESSKSDAIELTLGLIPGEGQLNRVDASHAQGGMNLLEVASEKKRAQSATKADDAEIPLYLWNSRLTGSNHSGNLDWALDQIRSFVLNWWKQSVTCSFLTWFKSTHCCKGRLPPV